MTAITRTMQQAATWISPMMRSPRSPSTSTLSCRSRYPPGTFSPRENLFLIRQMGMLDLSWRSANHRWTWSIAEAPLQMMEQRTGSRMLAAKGQWARGCGGEYFLSFSSMRLVFLGFACRSSTQSRHPSESWLLLRCGCSSAPLSPPSAGERPSDLLNQYCSLTIGGGSFESNPLAAGLASFGWEFSDWFSWASDTDPSPAPSSHRALAEWLL
mmetsp:Transcript_31044/g.83372  ORF Transcript_31044/g.83372 Transcript_31044/m.83372 type:complete len:213 (+) Transcript_31044:339-977(+)